MRGATARRSSGRRARGSWETSSGSQLILFQNTRYAKRSSSGKEVGALSDSPEYTRPRTLGTAIGVVAAALGCAPTLNVLGVYFPAWLVSAVVGLVVAYALVWWLGRRPGPRALAQSGLFFCGLTVMLALLIWWIFFSGF